MGYAANLQFQPEIGRGIIFTASRSYQTSDIPFGLKTNPSAYLNFFMMHVVLLTGRVGPLRNLADIFSSDGKKPVCNNRAFASSSETSKVTRVPPKIPLYTRRESSCKDSLISQGLSFPLTTIGQKISTILRQSQKVIRTATFYLGFMVYA